MTRKHFNELAKALNVTQSITSSDSIVYQQWLTDCHAIARVCQEFNSNFDIDRFISACKGE